MSSLDVDTKEVAFADRLRKAVEEYQKKRPIYEAFTLVIEKILREALENRNTKVASIERRAKTIESFSSKASIPSSTEPNQPKYKHPLSEITDLAGIRVITFFPKTLHEVHQVVNTEFAVYETSDKAETLRQEERFGYQSIHYLISLKSERLALPEYAKYKHLIAEIQVRTILQHAWAEIEHDIQYKSPETIPSSIRRRFMSLAGLLEIADREFQAVQDEDQRITVEARKSVQEGKLESVEITPDALRAYLDKKLGSDGRMTNFSYEWYARTLRELGFTNFRQIDECIADYDDDTVSRLAWGARQGQLSRFETQLLAGMGEYFIRRHPWGSEPALRDSFRSRLTRLANGGIKIKDFQP